MYAIDYSVYKVFILNENISVRLDEKSMEDLEKVVDEWHSDRSETIRRLLAKALKQWKIEKALSQLRDHKISIGTAAKICGLDIWEMIELAKENNIDWTGYGKQDLEKDLMILEKKD